MMSLQYAVYYYYKDFKGKMKEKSSSDSEVTDGKEHVLERHKVRVKLTPRLKTDKSTNEGKQKKIRDREKRVGANDDTSLDNSYLRNLPKHREVLAKQNEKKRNTTPNGDSLYSENGDYNNKVTHSRGSNTCGASFFHMVMQSKKYIMKLAIAVVVVCVVIWVVCVLEGFYFTSTGCIEPEMPVSRSMTEAIFDGMQLPNNFRLYTDPPPPSYSSLLSAVGFY